jgi:hypothetical protein
MFVVAVLVVVTSSPGLMAQMPGGNPPRGMERERVRNITPPPSSPELRRLEGLRARFDFAAESNNRASLEVIDQELESILLQVEGPVRPPPADAGAPTEPPEDHPLTRAMLEARGRYDALGIKARRAVLNTLLRSALQDAAANQPPRDDSAPPPSDAPRPRGRRR